ncbi:MAG: hypothetical protein LBE56_12660 [Tannerella sp.]|jgi:hypothetical protein|nr:hypothetical protein [Tannerella sp.]
MPLDITKAITIENIYYASKNDGQILNSSNIINISSAPDLTTARQAYYFISNLTVDLSSPYEFPSRINCQNFFGVSPDTVIPSGKLSIKLTVDSSHPDWNWTSSTVPASFNNKSYYLDIQGSDTLKTVTAPLSSVQKGYSNLDLSNCTTVNKLYNTVYLGSTDNMPTYDLSSCTDCSNILNGLTVKDAPTDTIIEGGILDTNIPILTNTGNIKNAANAFYGIKAAWINNPFTNPETSLNNTFAACDKLVTFANKSGDFHLISGNQTGVFNGCTSLKYFKNYTNNDIEIHIEATTTGQSSSIDCSSFFNSCSSLESVTIYMDNILP